jgi:hypothetical protein
MHAFFDFAQSLLVGGAYEGSLGNPAAFTPEEDK